MCDLAARYGMEALVEFNPYSGCRSLAEAAELAREAGRPNGKLLIDVLHLSRSGGSPEDARKLDPALVPLVHFCDAPPRPTDDRSVDELRRELRTARLLPGEGSLWLTELLDALAPDVAISVEAPSARHAHLPAGERARLAFAGDAEDAGGPRPLADRAALAAKLQERPDVRCCAGTLSGGDAL